MVRADIQKTQETEVEDDSESYPLPELCPLSGKGVSAIQEKKNVGSSIDCIISSLNMTGESRLEKTYHNTTAC